MIRIEIDKSLKKFHGASTDDVADFVAGFGNSCCPLHFLAEASEAFTVYVLSVLDEGCDPETAIKSVERLMGSEGFQQELVFNHYLKGESVARVTAWFVNLFSSTHANIEARGLTPDRKDYLN